jgi:phage baseplate assembly protein W|tara:strand:- start:4961 stop:5446 length:486 start_codon:yes stop_codon:yes gene_type:complete
MAIKIKSLEVDSLVKESLKKDYLYKDIEFDLSPKLSFNNQLNKQEYLKDVSVLYDIEAIKNSIVTAFLTSPGDKILSPLYGVDLRQYIFEPVDDFTADIIQEDIESKLPRMEPRITVKNVEVIGDEDANSYYINLQIDVPSLDIRGLSIKSELNSVGYTVI